MGRRKVRNFPSREDYEQQFEDYFSENKHSCIQYAVQKLGFNDVEEMHDAEFSGRFGFDCGWVQLIPRDKEMYREWRLDNGEYSVCIFDIGHKTYPTQSVTIKRLILEKAVEDMNLQDVFIINERLD